MPYTGFSGPIPSVNLTIDRLSRKLSRPRQQAYGDAIHLFARFSACFSTIDRRRRLIGGNFWDGRATGYLLQSPDAEQAQHPPVDTGEMGFPDTACIAFRLSHAAYRALFERYGADSFDFHWPAEHPRRSAHAWRSRGLPRKCDADPLSPAERDQGERGLRPLGGIDLEL